MNCQACDLPLTQYSEHQVSCKNGHVWTLPEYADQPATRGPDTPALKRAKVRDRLPLWPLAALPGIAALILELF